MSSVTTGLEGLPPHNDVGAHRHAEYYIRGGDAHFRARDTQFCIHSYFFRCRSEYWHGRISDPDALGERQGVLGSSEATPFVLDEDPADFARFLWAIYNPRYGIHETSADQWTVILRLATEWGFREARELAFRHMKTIQMDDIERINIFQRHNAPHSFILPLLVELASPERELTHDEFLALEGDTTKYCVTRAREKLLRALPATAASGNPPTPSFGCLGDEERSRIVSGVLEVALPEAVGEFEVQPNNLSLLGPPPNTSLVGGEDRDREVIVNSGHQVATDDIALGWDLGWDLVQVSEGERAVGLSQGFVHGPLMHPSVLLPYCLVVSLICALIA
ncbi:hypothetical protein P691DRAFT_763631 [Macrolepiota fuliginosa MF-IS2]|uniref:BTB domain-containing protein n=1 Tax=Macrolepiota fuliginosa MF-IS2 TaxID=1400762 RepID=A0A9P5X6C0_9AGAR|nr:hypothetical protein P691DRAFT_763631 [Macrolepiota fuliginosa MF-IS2]